MVSSYHLLEMRIIIKIAQKTIKIFKKNVKSKNFLNINKYEERIYIYIYIIIFLLLINISLSVFGVTKSKNENYQTLTPAQEQQNCNAYITCSNQAASDCSMYVQPSKYYDNCYTGKLSRCGSVPSYC